ncbi:hypothetical protein ISF_08251 [Cordyceps fumosorosea ARSEF 2679]|uniref:AB hydrolase-1 domain-containing protein n=1 Tax=Cordyceps fumosorosea (strain ARSEF 2679) TaxID=1081104 RepID=A0A162MDK4_CORFA|nr:hypothetical protein ISF_08251 [Cordyceps fumosorosea ARSEF 2679]OAA54650.1 hypothetical protein ISF_08251 [Cordyceps fumosorosea ARSEF 2679]
MSAKPTLVFVHGAWHRPETWDKVNAEVAAKGYKGIAVTLPSTLGDRTTTFGDDVRAAQDVIRQETDAGRHVVLVVHSYGGQVGNSAVQGFSRHSPGRDATAPAHVIGLVMIATGFTVTGVAFLEAMGGTPPPSWRLNDGTGFAEIVAEPRDMLYHDLPEEEGRAWVARMTKQAQLPLTGGGEHAYAGWREVPTWYLKTVEDHALPVQLRVAREEGADVTDRGLPTSHSPMLSRPREVGEFIDEAAQYFVSKQ